VIIKFTSLSRTFYEYTLPLIVARQIENVANGEFKLLVHVLLVETHFSTQIDDLQFDVILFCCKGLGTDAHHIWGDFWH